MLSIEKVRNARYYIDLAAADYFLEGGEPPGEWWGGGADALGLAGTVIRRHFLGVMSGFSPAGRKLRRNAGTKHKKKDRPGFDLTFTPPKSVSVLWALGSKRVRRAIQRCQRRAVFRVLRYLEEELAFVRKGQGGYRQLHGKLIAALFEHGTSRLNDPNLHTHAVIANVLLAGTETGALDASKLYDSKMFLGALYRIELAHLLRRTLRVTFRRVKTWFEIRGIKKRILDFFSKRRAEVLAEQRRTGNKGARSAAVAAKETRKPKAHRPRKELLREWKEQAKEQGVSLRAIYRRFTLRTETEVEDLPDEPLLKKTAASFVKRIARAIKSIAETRSHFTLQAVVRLVAPHAVRLGLSVDQVLGEVRNFLATSPEIVSLGIHAGESRYAWTQTLDLEAELLTRVDALRDKPNLEVHAKTRESVLANGRDLSDEQWRAYNYLVNSPGRIKVLSGLPGTGKTHILEESCKAWEQSGYRVIAAAIAGRAARNLEQKSGIKSHTVERVKRDLEATIWHDTKHYYTQAKRFLAGKPVYALKRIKLDARTIFVVDEAAMLNTEYAAAILRQVDEAGAKLVLVGDHNQILPIGVGAPYASIEQRVEHVQLDMIRRLRQYRDVEAVHTLLAGDARSTIDNYEKRGLLHIAETRREATHQLINDWKTLGGLEAPQKHLILVGTNEERQQRNRQCQEARRKAGMITCEGLAHRRKFLGPKEFFSVGDQVMFLENDQRLDVCNGDLATVLSTEKEGGRWLTVRLHQNDKEVRFSLDHYEHLTLSYALTLHKVQGSDFENILWQPDTSRLSREMACTALTRHRESLRIYVDRIDAGKNLEHLEAGLRTSAREPLAMELLQQHVERQGQATDLPSRPLLLEEELAPSVELALARLERAKNPPRDEPPIEEEQVSPPLEPQYPMKRQPDPHRHAL